MRQEKQRTVGYYVLECNTSHDKARRDIFKFAEIAESILAECKKGPCKREYDNGDKTICIRQIYKDNDDFLSILLSCSDAKKPNPTFEHLETGEQRTEKKKERERE